MKIGCLSECILSERDAWVHTSGAAPDKDDNADKEEAE